MNLPLKHVGIYDYVSSNCSPSLCSGPKRYDVIEGRWRYSHDGEALHDLLTREFSEALGTELDFTKLKHSYLLTEGDNWS